MSSDELPATWRLIVKQAIPLGRVAPRVQEVGRPDLPALSVYLGLGVVPRAGRLDNHNRLGEDLAKYQVVRPGDVVFNKLRTWQGGLGVSDYTGIVSPAYFVCRPVEAVEPRYLRYLLVSSLYLAEMTRISKWMPPSQFDVSWSDLKKLPIRAPSLETQRRIADFLDDETAQIDRLIAKQTALIDTLRERRTAVIHATVATGLDGTSLAGTFLPWLGHLSIHWTADQLGRHSTIGNGSTPSRDDMRYWTDGDFPWLNSSVVNRPSVTEADQFVTATALEECHLPIVRAGSVVVGLTGEGRTRGMSTRLEITATISQHLAYVTPSDDRWDSRYLTWVLTAGYPELRRMSEQNGSTKGALTCGQLSSFVVPCPPLAEQLQIADNLDEQTEKIDALIAKAEQFVELAKERRTALITVAVTGQLDLRDVA